MSANLPLKVNAVAFDLDGTLVNTLPDLVEAANKMLSRYDYPAVDTSKLQKFVGHGIDFLVEELIKSINARPKIIDLSEAKSVFRREYTECVTCFSSIYPGVLETLEQLKKLGVSLFCITNKPDYFTKKILSKMGLEKYFDLIISGDTLPHRKPNPISVRFCCEAFNLLPARVLMIGDSLTDVQTARAAKCPVFCVSYGYHGLSSVDSLQADAILDCLRDIFSFAEVSKCKV